MTPRFAGGVRPPSSAATATAPAPSTTSFVRSRHRYIASAMASSPTTTTSSSSRSISGCVRVPRPFTAMPSAIVRLASVTRTPTSCTSGRASLTASAIPRRQAAAPHRDDHLGEVADVLDELEAERALPRDHVRVVVGVHEDQAAVVGELLGRDDALGQRARAAVDGGAVAGDRVALGDRRVVRDEDLAGDAAGGRGGGDALPVVAGRGADDAAGAVGADGGELGRGAADLERAGALEVLRLERDGAARGLGEGARRQDRRAPGDGLDGRAGRRDIAGGDHQSGRATIASISTRAPLGSAATPTAARAGRLCPTYSA